MHARPQPWAGFADTLLNVRGTRVGVIATAFLAMCVSSCGANTTSHTFGDNIVIGVTLGLTKSFDSLSAPLRNAIKLAEAQVNAGGGVLGRQVEYRIVDDTSTAEGARARVSELIEGGAVAILGPLGSGQVPMSYEVAKAKNLIQISPTATSIVLNGDAFRGGFYRTTPDDVLQAAAVARLARFGPPPTLADAGGGFVCSRMHIMYGDNDYGRSMQQTISEIFAQNAQPPPTKTAIPDAPKNNYDADVAAAVFDNTVHPQCLVLILYDDTGAPIMLSYDKLKKTRTGAVQFIVATDGLFTQGFLDNTRTDRQIAASSVAEGVYGTNPDTSPESLNYNDYKALYKTYYQDAEPGAFSANAYDAAVLVALGIAQAGSTNPAAIRDAVKLVSSGGRPYGPSQVGEALRVLQPKSKKDAKEDIDYQGASGDVDFTDDVTSVKAGFITWKVQAGTFETVDHVGADKL